MKPIVTLKRTAGFFLSLVMILTVLTVPVFADPASGSVTVKKLDGTSVTITKAELESAQSTETTFTYNETNTVQAKFYSMSNIFENAGIDLSDIHGVKAVASDGFVTGYLPEDVSKLYLYFDAEGKINMAINGSAGNKWAKDVVAFELTSDHAWFVKKGFCKHYCAICGADEPAITLISGEETKTVHDCEIKDANHVDTTFTFGTNSVTARFYSMKSIFESAGFDLTGAHGISAVASDAFVTGYKLDQLNDLHIYVEDGKYRTAINGSAGNKWAKDVVTFSVAQGHVWFVKKGACRHYCAICDEEEELEKNTDGSCLHRYEDCKGEEAAAVDAEKNCLHKYAICGESLIEKKEAKAATEQAEGNIAYFICKGCKKIFADAEATTELEAKETIIPKLAPLKQDVVQKKNQTIKVTKKTKTVKYRKLKKSNVTLKKLIRVKGNKGTVSYKLLTKNSKIKVNKKTGAITLKKGIKKKKALKVKVLVKAAATDTFKAASKKVTVVIKMK